MSRALRPFLVAHGRSVVRVRFSFCRQLDDDVSVNRREMPNRGSPPVKDRDFSLLS